MLKKTLLIIVLSVYPIIASATNDLYMPTFGDEDISISPMQEFSGLTKKEILKARTAAVKNSALFSSPNYTPSKDVFQIVDKLPWISAYEISCNGASPENTGAGDSRESLGILNPELLFYVDILAYGFKQKNGCSEDDYLLPYKLTYNTTEKRLTAHVNYTAFYAKNHRYSNTFIKDANARDMGYNYAYADITDNIRFKSKPNLSTKIIRTRGFYHHGYSCQIKGGCNNYSPYETGYTFYLTNIPAALNIKLWKNEPKDPSDSADITFRLIFD